MVSFPFIILGMRSGKSHGLIPIHHPRNEDVHSHWSKVVPRKQSVQQTDKSRHSGNSCSSQWSKVVHCILFTARLYFDLVFYCMLSISVRNVVNGPCQNGRIHLCSCTQLVDPSMLIDMWVEGG